MPQLLVRDIESAVVNKLRRRAAAQGVSVEEAHQHGSNPLETLEQKIAQLRERCNGAGR